MPKQCCAGALLQCSFGTCPTALNVLPTNMVFTTTPAATIMDNKPMLNIPTFVMCTSPANPAVIASLGAPAPCVPNVVAPWVIGVPNVLIGSMPALNDQSKAICMFGGLISVNFAGQVFVDVG